MNIQGLRVFGVLTLVPAKSPSAMEGSAKSSVVNEVSAMPSAANEVSPSAAFGYSASDIPSAMESSFQASMQNQK